MLIFSSLLWDKFLILAIEIRLRIICTTFVPFQCFLLWIDLGNLIHIRIIVVRPFLIYSTMIKWQLWFVLVQIPWMYSFATWLIQVHVFELVLLITRLVVLFISTIVWWISKTVSWRQVILRLLISLQIVNTLIYVLSFSHSLVIR